MTTSTTFSTSCSRGLPHSPDDMSFCRFAALRAAGVAKEILKTVQSAADVLDSVDEDKRWVTVAFTWNGLKALGWTKHRSTRSRMSSNKACPHARNAR